MSLRKEQSQFSRDFAEFIIWLYAEGYEVTDGEAWRPPEMQRIYVDTGRSKTMESLHLRRLAKDINIFKDGVLLSSKSELQFAGNKWESMSAANTWGGNWNSFKDCPHFQRTVR